MKTDSEPEPSVWGGRSRPRTTASSALARDLNIPSRVKPTGSVYGFSSGISFTAGEAGIELRYAHISRRSASGITFGLKVGMLLADGCRTNAMKAAVAIGL